MTEPSVSDNPHNSSTVPANSAPYVRCRIGKKVGVQFASSTPYVRRRIGREAGVSIVNSAPYVRTELAVNFSFSVPLLIQRNVCHAARGGVRCAGGLDGGSVSVLVSVCFCVSVSVLQHCFSETSAANWEVPWPGSPPCRVRFDRSDGTSFDHFDSLR